jgi:hypothetical protein
MTRRSATACRWRRAFTSKARRGASAGHHAEASPRYAPVDIWFPNGYDTANLQGVKALWEVLAGKDDRHTTLLQQNAQF